MAAGVVQVSVERIAVNRERRPFVILTDKPQSQVLPIPIGLPEATAIYLELEHHTFPRPLTHDLVASVMRGLGVGLRCVTVTDVRDGTFYALMDVMTNGDVHQVDARPSDAIAIALRMDADIFVSSDVLEKAGMPYDEALPQPGFDSDEKEREIQQFRDLLLDWDLDDR
jgi:bifunctional DNase/RNase